MRKYASYEIGRQRKPPESPEQCCETCIWWRNESKKPVCENDKSREFANWVFGWEVCGAWEMKK